MAGHSKFKNILHRNGAQDAKRAKVFTKIQREITVAVKASGPDANANPRLRTALIAARGANMPNDLIKRAVDKASGANNADNYDTIRYEGYGPGGVAVIIEALTDNRTRTVAEVRTAFSKQGGALGETNSVAFMFDHVGEIIYPAKVANAEAMFEAALNAGADNVESDDEGHWITCAIDGFAQVRDVLVKTFGEPEKAGFVWNANVKTPVDEDTARSMLKLIDVLEDNDDIQNVYTNFEISDDILARLAG